MQGTLTKVREERCGVSKPERCGDCEQRERRMREEQTQREFWLRQMERTEGKEEPSESGGQEEPEEPV